jgi:predicted site-specific integrase-resolvase
VVHDFNVWWVVVYGRVITADWKADGDRKRKKSCDWSDTKVLAVPIALTLKVKMNCSAILALLSCG